MSEPHEERAETSESGTTALEQSAPPEQPMAPRDRQRKIWLAGALLVIISLVATEPLWAPLLPWGPGPSGDEAALEDRIDRIAAAQQQSRRAEAAATAALQSLDRRVGGLEANPAAPASDIAELRQRLVQLAATVADLTPRIEAIDKAVRSRATGDPTDIALVLALLQIRDAVEAGRPFAAAYEALVALAYARPEIAAAAVALAEPATNGLVDRAVLANRLRELAGAIATAKAPPANTPASGAADAGAAAPDWADQAWQRLRGLVTIRRIDDAAPPPPSDSAAIAVNAALRALAGGDLEGAIGALDPLTGAPAEAAGPWLRMAKERLAVEAALQRIEALLVARLGSAANAAAGSGPPR
jgi:hypothetical protein